MRLYKKNDRSERTMRSRRTVLKTGIAATIGISGLSTTGAAQQEGDESGETYLLSVFPQFNGAPISADVTVDGETKSTTNAGGDMQAAEFEVENGTYTVSATGKYYGYRLSGESETEIDGTNNRDTIILTPDYPELDHVAYDLEYSGQDDTGSGPPANDSGIERYVASGTIENNTDEESLPFAIAVDLYNSDLTLVRTTLIRGEGGPFTLDPGESVNWSGEVIRDEDNRFEAVDPENYDIRLVVIDDHLDLSFSEIEVRGGADDPVDGDPDDPGEAPDKRRDKGRKRGKGKERGKGRKRSRGRRPGKG